MTINTFKTFYCQHPYHIHYDNNGNEIVSDDEGNQIQADPDTNGQRWYLTEHYYTGQRTAFRKLIPLSPTDGPILYQKYKDYVKIEN
jgi:hypothetical protein